MRKSYMIALLVAIVAIAAYFSKSYWMNGIVKNEEVIEDTILKGIEIEIYQDTYSGGVRNKVDFAGRDALSKIKHMPRLVIDSGLLINSYFTGNPYDNYNKQNLTLSSSTRVVYSGIEIYRYSTDLSSLIRYISAGKVRQCNVDEDPDPYTEDNCIENISDEEEEIKSEITFSQSGLYLDKITARMNEQDYPGIDITLPVYNHGLKTAYTIQSYPWGGKKGADVNDAISAPWIDGSKDISKEIINPINNGDYTVIPGLSDNINILKELILLIDK